ncbi:MAG: OmpA family protein [Treponema sp.]|uniref:OmpA family protein n=1 Tax=unclassified Treponema TaxID=2638727 RepID=UPI0020A38E3D|nr:MULTISPECIES: OmpA family protein [unclassified Treponema]UTC54145.1 OmpA family protein [Treponema sp. OMZ 803]UTC56543.1 OmpA family protein [Treponema sp. OMZ 906]
MKHSVSLTVFVLCALAFCYGYPSGMESQTVQNWETAQVDSKITIDLNKSGLYLPTDRNAAIRLIQQNRSSLLKNAYLSILVDSSHRIGNYLAEEKISFTDINTVINNGKSTAPILSQELQTAIIYHQNPLQELANLFVKHNAPYTPSFFPFGTASKVYTGILIDARGQLPVHGEYSSEQLNPCLFPKIWNKNMNLIYEKNIVDPDQAKKHSIVLYTGTLDESEYRDRIGTEPLRIIARGVFGDNRTDPIISNEDAERILAKKENIELLRQGKIVIVCDKDTLQVSPTYPLVDEQFYFMYHDIEKFFLDREPESISVKAPENVIKITMHDEILFVADSAEILPDETDRLNIIAEALKKVGPNTHFLIEGHTADLNRPEGQRILSLQRADKIAEELAKRGIEANRMQTAGYGATRPIAPNDTAENRAKNRRVEITILRD